MNEQLARAAFSRVIEPPEPAATWLIETMGAVDAWEWFRALPDQVSPAVSELLNWLGAEHDGERARRQQGLEMALARWRTRLPVTPELDLRAIERLGGTLLLPHDEGWPAGLDDLGLGAPVCLWLRGEAKQLSRPVALVGSRAATMYGTDVAMRLADELARRGHGIVSGGAYGVDISAHRAALAARGATHAYLACGLEKPYPLANAVVLDHMLESGGAWISEYAPGATPLRHRFLARNRLIAASSLATVVVEASWRSGALNTANLAADLGRPVGAVPGSVHSAESQGTHRLIRENRAVLVTDADEIVELIAPIQPDLDLGVCGEPTRAELGEEGLRVWGVLGDRKVQDLSKLSQAAGLPAWETSAVLGSLELAGFAAQREGGWVRAWPPGRSRNAS